MIVEPFANDSVEENLNPVGRVFYGASTVICTPASLDQEVGLALGAQAGEESLTEVIKQGGFKEVRLGHRDSLQLGFGGSALSFVGSLLPPSPIPQRVGTSEQEHSAYIRPHSASQPSTRPASCKAVVGHSVMRFTPLR